VGGRFPGRFAYTREVEGRKSGAGFSYMVVHRTTLARHPILKKFSLTGVETQNSW
jgi:hypothetical protein